MVHPDAEKWDAIYRSGGHHRQEPVKVLKNYSHLLPSSGTALEPACGRGANALYLAQRGLDTSAWDISEEAIRNLDDRARQLGLQVNTRVCDVVTNSPPANSFDVIVISYFLDRPIIPHLIRALKLNGLLFYQTFIRERIDDTGPGNDDYRFAENELLLLCRDLHIVLYHEEGMIGNTRHGFRNEAMLIGQRR
jgi:tellurite methyltransferase